jgi:WD40 repeat protein
VAFSPDGTQIVSGSGDKTLRLWDAVSRAHLNTLKGHYDSVCSVAFSPDGTQIVSGSSDGTLRLWDAVSGAHLNTLEIQSYSVDAVAFSPDGTQIMSRSNNQTLELWDTVTGHTIDTSTPSIQRSHLIQKNQTSFYLLISDDGWIWSIDPKQRLCWIPPSYQPSNVNCLATNRTSIALGSNDGRVIILNLSGKPFI